MLKIFNATAQNLKTHTRASAVRERAGRLPIDVFGRGLATAAWGEATP